MLAMPTALRKVNNDFQATLERGRHVLEAVLMVVNIIK